MKKSGIVLGALFGLLVGGAATASATTFTLDNCNGTVANPCHVGTVTELYNSGTLTITATANTGFAFGTGTGAALIGWEFAGVQTPLSGYNLGSLNGVVTPLLASPSMDGFSGDINLGLNGTCSPGAPCSTISFTISGPNITLDTVFSQFVLHFVELGLTPGAPNITTGFVESLQGSNVTPVPEPASMMLLGTGLVFFARRFRRQ